MGDRPATPPAVARQLRKEAGYGCCICGRPFYQYHHIVEYSERPHFEPEHMMILCAEHHHEMALKLHTKEQQYAIKANPHNRDQNLTGGVLFTGTGQFVVKAGGNSFFGDFSLEVDGYRVLGICDEDGTPLVSASLQGPNGESLLEIADNEWLLNKDEVWDFESARHKVTVRRKEGERLNALRFESRLGEVTVSGEFWHAGKKIEIGHKSIWANDRTVSSASGATKVLVKDGRYIFDSSKVRRYIGVGSGCEIAGDGGGEIRFPGTHFMLNGGDTLTLRALDKAVFDGCFFQRGLSIRVDGDCELTGTILTATTIAIDTKAGTSELKLHEEPIAQAGPPTRRI